MDHPFLFLSVFPHILLLLVLFLVVLHGRWDENVWVGFLIFLSLLFFSIIQFSFLLVYSLPLSFVFYWLELCGWLAVVIRSHGYMGLRWLRALRHGGYWSGCRRARKAMLNLSPEGTARRCYLWKRISSYINSGRQTSLCLTCLSQQCC